MKFIGPYEVVLGVAMFPPKKTPKKRRAFTEEEDAFIMKHYKKLGCNVVCRILGRKFHSVCSRALTIGARKSGKK